LLATIMLILDDSSPCAVVVDRTLPASAATLHAAIAETWPRLDGRVAFVQCGLDEVEVLSTDIVVASHACGELTDCVLARASEARARVAVLPCCHDFAVSSSGELAGWVDRSVAIDIVRAMRLERQGYRIWTQTIPADVTPKNRLLVGAPLPA
jgi:hypothetical protein